MINKEIGSEFWTDCSQKSNKQDYSMRPLSIYDNHHYQIVETLSGRTALEHIVEILVKKGKKSAYLPAYCCHTMIEPFLTNGMNVSFYDVELTDKGLHRVIDKNHHYDSILLLDYFGHTDTETFDIALREKGNGVITIYDATHSMYSDINYYPYDFIYGSYRKWVNINCGFLAWKDNLCIGEIIQNDNNREYVSIRQILFDKKALYIQGGAVKKEEFLPLIEQAEMILEDQYHHKLPDVRSMEVLKTVDAAFIKARRKDNAMVLTAAIYEMNDERIRCITPVLNTSDVPLFVSVIIAPEIRNMLRRYLIGHQIYCPVHWPLSEIHCLMPGSKQLFESELSLICDQRYDTDDMNRITETIKQYLKL